MTIYTRHEKISSRCLSLFLVLLRKLWIVNCNRCFSLFLVVVLGSVEEVVDCKLLSVLIVFLGGVDEVVIVNCRRIAPSINNRIFPLQIN